MSPQDTLIIIVAVLDALFLIALAVAGLKFMALARRGGEMARPLVERGRRIAGTGQSMAGTARAKAETIHHVVARLVAHLSAKAATTRRILSEVAHPDTATLHTVNRTLEQGRAWSDRLARLRAAAQRAAGENGHNRRRVKT